MNKQKKEQIDFEEVSDFEVLTSILKIFIFSLVIPAILLFTIYYTTSNKNMGYSNKVEIGILDDDNFKKDQLLNYALDALTKRTVNGDEYIVLKKFVNEDDAKKSLASKKIIGYVKNHQKDNEKYVKNIQSYYSGEIKLLPIETLEKRNIEFVISDNNIDTYTVKNLLEAIIEQEVYEYSIFGKMDKTQLELAFQEIQKRPFLASEIRMFEINMANEKTNILSIELSKNIMKLIDLKEREQKLKKSQEEEQQKNNEQNSENQNKQKNTENINNNQEENKPEIINKIAAKKNNFYTEKTLQTEENQNEQVRKYNEIMQKKAEEEKLKVQQESIKMNQGIRYNYIYIVLAITAMLAGIYFLQLYKKLEGYFVAILGSILVSMISINAIYLIAFKVLHIQFVKESLPVLAMLFGAAIISMFVALLILKIVENINKSSFLDTEQIVNKTNKIYWAVLIISTLFAGPMQSILNRYLPHLNRINIIYLIKDYLITYLHYGFSYHALANIISLVMIFIVTIISVIFLGINTKKYNEGVTNEIN